MTLDDAFDLTPELKAAAQEEMKKYRLGPLYTPPSLQGTLMRPGMSGGANWGGGAFDPSSGTAVRQDVERGEYRAARQARHSPRNPRASEVDADLTRQSATPSAEFMDGMPLIKPPYGASDRDRSESRHDRVARAVRRYCRRCGGIPRSRA